MDLENPNHIGYYFIIEINTEHPAIQEHPLNFMEFPGNERAMFSSADFADANECNECMKTTVAQEISKMNDMMKGANHSILLESNDFTDEEKQAHPELFDELEWSESEMHRMYGIDNLTTMNDFSGHEWFIRARMYYNDYGKYVFPPAENLH